MDYINRSIDYIEENLKAPITLDDIAQAACCSKFHFQRLFTLVTGETAGAYLRKRRITQAAYDLIHTKKSILDIAMDYQFQSQEAFTRSFKTFYHTTPLKYRKRGHFSRLTSKHAHTESSIEHLGKGISREPEFIVLEEKIIAGVYYYGTDKDAILKVWSILYENQEKIPGQVCPGIYYGYNLFDKTALVSGNLHYLAGVEVSEELESIPGIPAETRSFKLPPSEYAVFSHQGPPEQIPTSYQYIYEVWYPNSGYNFSKWYSFDYLDARYQDDFFKTQEAFKIYIPIDSEDKE